MNETALFSRGVRSLVLRPLSVVSILISEASKFFFGGRKAGKFSSADLGKTVELLFDCLLHLV